MTRKKTPETTEPVILGTKRTWVTFSVDYSELQEKLNEFETLGFAIIFCMCSRPWLAPGNGEEPHESAYTVVAVKVETTGGRPGKELPAQNGQVCGCDPGLKKPSPHRPLIQFYACENYPDCAYGAAIGAKAIVRQLKVVRDQNWRILDTLKRLEDQGKAHKVADDFLGSIFKGARE